MYGNRTISPVGVTRGAAEALGSRIWSGGADVGSSLVVMVGVLALAPVVTVSALELAPVSGAGDGSGVVEASDVVYGGNSYASDFTCEVFSAPVGTALVRGNHW